MQSDTLPQMTVSDITRLIKDTLEGSFYNLTIEGEISGFKPASSGHWYFSLKDKNSVIGAAMWKQTAAHAGFIPKDGQKVIVTGNISVYEPRGTYSIVCSSMRPAGEGDILAMLEERKRQYSALGWFAPELKRQLPKRPSKVAVITSPTGAALQDILQITGRRNNGMDIVILPAVVQGEDAARSIASRIHEVNEFLLADVMIVGRGGGSIEDLLPFSEDCVIQAIHESQVPVISAVGHEIDWALSDFVADLRAPTPSAAAELVCESSLDQLEKVNKIRSRMTEELNSRIKDIRLRVAAFSPASAKARLEGKVSTMRMKLDGDVNAMKYGVGSLLSQHRTRLHVLQSNIRALSPVSVLERGFSIVTGPDGRTLSRIEDAKVDDSISISFANGQIGAKVTEVGNGR